MFGVTVEKSRLRSQRVLSEMPVDVEKVRDGKELFPVSLQSSVPFHSLQAVIHGEGAFCSPETYPSQSSNSTCLTTCKIRLRVASDSLACVPFPSQGRHKPNPAPVPAQDFGASITTGARVRRGFSVGAGRGSRTPKGRSPADFESEYILL